MAPGILETAAGVRQTKIELDAICKELRHAGAEWTGYAIAIEDAMKIADDGLRNCWSMLDRIRTLAQNELSRHAA